MSFSLGRGPRVVARAAGFSVIGVVAVLGAGSAVSAQTQPGPDRTVERELPASIAELELETPESTTAASADFLEPGVGSQDGDKVIVRLSAEAGATAWVGGRDELNARRAAREQQDAFIARVKSIDPDAKVLGGSSS